LVKQLTDPQLQEDYYGLRDHFEEIFTITGNRLGYNPEVFHYASPPVNNQGIDSWLKEYRSEYSAGNLYKFGFLQDISLMQE
jgi:hypothetical protein